MFTYTDSLRVSFEIQVTCENIISLHYFIHIHSGIKNRMMNCLIIAETKPCHFKAFYPHD